MMFGIFPYSHGLFHPSDDIETLSKYIIKVVAERILVVKYGVRSPLNSLYIFVK